MTSPSTANGNNINIRTYRHEFGKEFMANLSCFSKVHQYDDRHTYKSEWAKWTQQIEIAQAIDVEKRHLNENGYTGDIEDKMFKAGRYYFRKKTVAAIAQQQQLESSSSLDGTPIAAATTPTTAPRQRRPYITMSKVCIQLMDEHIKNMHATAATAATVVVFKPSSCYDDFNQTKMSSDEMTKEIGNIIEKYEKNAAGATTNISPDELTNEIIDKIKKTYKNRYYKFTSSQDDNDINDINDNINDINDINEK
jgi:hypothetical protein